MTGERLLFAEWLIESGAGASARSVLGQARGREANALRLRSGRVRLLPGVHALVAAGDGVGIALPLHPQPGRAFAADGAFREASDLAATLARNLLGVDELPALRLPFETHLAASGPSIGLPALLAYLAYLAPDRAPRRPVLASGRIDPEGRVHAVGHLAEKLDAARAERAAGAEALVLLPAANDAPAADAVPVRTVAEAVGLVFGDTPLSPDPALFRVDRLLERARRDPDPAHALALLDTIDRDALGPADRLRYHAEVGTRLRHLGRPVEAAEHHALARGALEAHRTALGAELAERLEIEHWSTRLALHEVDAVVAALTARLEAPFLAAHNALRARGVLAFALGVAGRSAEAVRVRHENLALHDASAELAATRPFTLCYLVLDSALAGDATAFERYAAALVAHTPPGDDKQWRYAAAVLLRSLVCLRREGEALAWAAARSRLFGAAPPAFLPRLGEGTDAVATHPEVAIARSLAAAHRRRGDLPAVRRWAARVAAGPGLFGWIAELVRLECVAALAAAGASGEAAERLAAVREAMWRADPGACRHHEALLRVRPSELAVALDAVWY